MTLKAMKWAWLLPGACGWMVLAGSNPGWAQTPKTSKGMVAYSDLKTKKVSLPYGEPFTVDLMQAQSVAGNYATSDGYRSIGIQFADRSLPDQVSPA